MGVYCEINLFKPRDGRVARRAYTSNTIVSGIIKYGVDKVTVFDKITVSLKGIGVLRVTEDQGRHSSTSTRKETYVGIENIIVNGKKSHEIGMYKTRFDFMLPDNIPSTLHYSSADIMSDEIKCDITYFIRITFERPGLFQLTKRFNKELTVISKIKPTLPKEPIIYGEQKSLFQLLAAKKSIVNIKANMKKSVIPMGGNIYFECEVTNDTNITIKRIEVKLVENHQFTLSSGRVIKKSKNVKNTDCKTGPINSGEKEKFGGRINVSSDISSLRNSKIVARNYLVRITVALPFPHTNLVLDIPVELGDIAEDIELEQEALQDQAVGNDMDNPPPYYWEAMRELTKDDDFKGRES